MTRNAKKEAAIGLLFILPSLAGTVCFVIAPFFISIWYSITSGITDVKIVWLDNYVDLLKSPAFQLAAKNTLVYMGAGVPLALVISLAAGMALSRRASSMAMVSMLTPYIVPVSAVIAGWSMLLGDDGIAVRIAAAAGRKMPGLLSGDAAMGAAVALYVWKNIGYLAVIFTSAISQIPKEHYEVFDLESTSEAKKALYVTIPLAMPAALFAMVIAVANSFRAFRDIHAIFGTDPPKSVYMLAHFMNNNFFKLNYQRLTTASLMLASVLFAGIWLALKAQERYVRSQL
ncbi:MAG: sugar ABC transporter permease [Clostridiales bacterium]|jgi:multiple sugar transport system permease protein|nr:sugar ABC transporter permease [Clostridiales bacterium]MDR2751172.1 sugar ABC transporter permease [Clostridiales bacterium]